jgi:hypothetical protein
MMWIFYQLCRIFRIQMIEYLRVPWEESILYGKGERGYREPMKCRCEILKNLQALILNYDIFLKI